MIADLSLEIYRFAHTHPGPHLLITGGVHGNEPCGMLALEKIVALIHQGVLEQKNGTLTILPLCNPRARALNRRFVDRNLNRALYRYDNPVHYEDHLSNILCPYLEACDILLDIHSYTAGGPPFLLLEDGAARNLAYGRAVGPAIMLHSWSTSYARLTGEGLPDPLRGQGTTEYARKHGALSLTLECGQHDDPASVDVAFAAALNVLAHFNLFDIPAALREKARATLPARDPVVLTLNQVLVKRAPGRLARDWKHLEPVKAGAVLALFDDGTQDICEKDGYFIMPKPKSEIGEEWGYVAVKENGAAEKD